MVHSGLYIYINEDIALTTEDLLLGLKAMTLKCQYQSYKYCSLTQIVTLSQQCSHNLQPKSQHIPAIIILTVLLGFSNYLCPPVYISNSNEHNKPHILMWNGMAKCSKYLHDHFQNYAHLETHPKLYPYISLQTKVSCQKQVDLVTRKD